VELEGEGIAALEEWGGDHFNRHGVWEEGRRLCNTMNLEESLWREKEEIDGESKEMDKDKDDVEL